MVQTKDSESNHTWQLEIEMMKYYQDEFKYRNSHFWSLLSKLFVLYSVITLFPICSEIMGIQIRELPEWSRMILPCVGIGVATFSYIVLRNEAKKISEINNIKYKINETCILRRPTAAGAVTNGS